MYGNIAYIKKRIAAGNDLSPAHGEALLARIVTMETALREIATYDENSKYGEGCCDYGCDTPSIAQAALSKIAAG